MWDGFQPPHKLMLLEGSGLYMKSYCSFLVINPSHSALIERLCTHESWSLRLWPDPSERFWFSQSGWRNISHPNALGEHGPDETLGQLMVFEAEEAIAKNIIQLVYAALNVIEGNPSERFGLPLAFEIPNDTAEQRSLFSNVFQTSGFFERFVYHPEIPVALSVAAKAWLNTSVVYAIHKLSRSVAADSITWWSTHPRYGQIFEKSSELHADFVNTSVAINLAFSAIEELQLQVKSNSKDKRWLNNVTAEWNPVVLEDIQKRLVEAGIDPQLKVSWMLRGDESISEVEIKPTLGSLAPYSDGQVVRDVELTLPEALHFCSYIRNFMTAHRFSEVSAFLGPYEVHNVQSVARRLILSKCGMWNIWTHDLLLKLEGEN